MVVRVATKIVRIYTVIIGIRHHQTNALGCAIA